jgi:hypothetical protein
MNRRKAEDVMQEVCDNLIKQQREQSLSPSGVI